MDEEGGERPTTTTSEDDAPTATATEEGEPTRVTRVILAVDVGSSGIRCCAYRLELEDDEEPSSPACTSDGLGEDVATAGRHRHRRRERVRAMSGCSSSIHRRSVEPNTGRILLHHHRHHQNSDGGNEGTTSCSCSSLLDDVDSCVDDTLDLVRSEFAGGGDDGDDPGSPGGGFFEVVGVGFSSFTMNLIGVDGDGEVVDGATFSYACNVPEVSEECRRLRRELGTEKLEALHQRTGCVVHSAYALPQLRHFYRARRHGGGGEEGSESSSMSSPPVVVHRWQTIASLCLRRWSGRDETLPMSYSEASWTGLLDVRTCRWDEGVLGLLPREFVDALPPLGDCTDPHAIPGGIREFRGGEGGGGEGGGGGDGREERRKNPYWDRWPELRGGGGGGAPPSSSGGDDGGVSSSRRQGCRLFLGVADGACANLGSKCSQPSRVAVTIGTSAAARVCLPIPRTRTRTGTSSGDKGDDRHDLDLDGDGDGGGGRDDVSITIPPGLFCYRVDGDHVVVGGALSDGGSVVEWARDLLNLNDDDEFGRCMDEVARLRASDADDEGGAGENDEGGRRGDGGGVLHSNRLSVVPFLSGERSTGYRDGAMGCVSGLTRETTPAMFLKACMEGVTLRLGVILRLIDGISSTDDGSTPREFVRRPDDDDSSPGEGGNGSGSAAAGLIVASGGALERNAVWRRMIADCTGRPVVMDSDVHESTSRGAARLVAASLTLTSNENENEGVWMEEEELSPVDVAEPAPDRRFWDEAADVQEEFIEAMSPLWR